MVRDADLNPLRAVDFKPLPSCVLCRLWRKWDHFRFFSLSSAQRLKASGEGSSRWFANGEGFQIYNMCKNLICYSKRLTLQIFVCSCCYWNSLKMPLVWIDFICPTPPIKSRIHFLDFCNFHNKITLIVDGLLCVLVLGIPLCSTAFFGASPNQPFAVFVAKKRLVRAAYLLACVTGLDQEPLCSCRTLFICAPQFVAFFNLTDDGAQNYNQGVEKCSARCKWQRKKGVFTHSGLII